MEESNQTHPVIAEQNFRLNIKKNFKGEIGYEYTVRGDTIEEIKARNIEMQGFIHENIKQ